MQYTYITQEKKNEIMESCRKHIDWLNENTKVSDGNVCSFLYDTYALAREVDKNYNWSSEPENYRAFTECYTELYEKLSAIGCPQEEFIVNEIETALAYGWSYIGDKSAKHMEDEQYVDFSGSEKEDGISDFYYDYTDQEKEGAVEEEEEEYIYF